MDKLLNALRETLSKLGLDESAIEAALQEAVAKAEGEEVPPSGDPSSDIPNGDPVPPTPEEVVNEGNGDPGNGDPAPVEVPPANGDPVPPSGDPVPPVPPFDPTPMLAQIDELSGKVTELTNQLAESEKARDGLIARVNSLEEALKKAGVIEGESNPTPVGDGNPGLNPGENTETSLNDVLAELNKKNL